MRTEDLHARHTEGSIRDLLSSTYRKSSHASGYETVEVLESELIKAKERLKHARVLQAVSWLIKDRGWKQHDISGYLDCSKEEYTHFIGTEEECESALLLLYETKNPSK